jgi:Sugar (and other) transporter
LGFEEYLDDFKEGALVAQVQNENNAFEHIDELSEEDKEILRYDVAHKWHQPTMLYFLVMRANYSQQNAFLVSLGTGIMNWLFAIPAIYTIDTFGRRNLLPTTFPLMSIFLPFTGFSFWIRESDGNARLACVAIGIYLFMVVYSPSEGPVPFTYSAEAFPLYIRDVGMSFATATTWGFNFIISFTFHALIKAFKPQGAFAWYACWNLFGRVFAYFLLPETKNLTLEELDSVFGFKSRSHAAYYAEKLPWYLKKYALRKDFEPFPTLYDTGSHDEKY